MYVKNDMVLSRTLRTVPTQAISADSQLELNVQKDNGIYNKKFLDRFKLSYLFIYRYTQHCLYIAISASDTWTQDATRLVINNDY